MSKKSIIIISVIAIVLIGVGIYSNLSECSICGSKSNVSERYEHDYCDNCYESAISKSDYSSSSYSNNTDNNNYSYNSNETDTIIMIMLPVVMPEINIQTQYLTKQQADIIRQIKKLTIFGFKHMS